MNSRLNLLKFPRISGSTCLPYPHNCCRDTRIAGTKLNDEGESEPVIGTAEERQEDMLIAGGSGDGQSAVDDKANVRLGSGKDFPDIMRVDHF